jgi:hypothetical protein
MAKEAEFTLSLFHWSKIMHLGLGAKPVTFVKILRVTRYFCWTWILEPVDSMTRSHDIAATFGEPGDFHLFFGPKFPFFHHAICDSFGLLVMGISHYYRA